MKKIFATVFRSKESWDGDKNKLHQLFTWLTGYYIFFEGSREDLIPKKIGKD